MLDTNTLVIGEESTGKTKYLRDKLADTEGVLWLSLGSPVPTGMDGVAIWDYKQWLSVTTAHKAKFQAAKVLVLDGLSNLQGLLLAGILLEGQNVGRNPEQKDYGAAGYRLYQGFLPIGALGLPMHASVLTREKETGTKDNKIKETEIFMSPMISSFILPSFPNAVYLTKKALAGNISYFAQENPALAKQLVASKEKVS